MSTLVILRHAEAVPSKADDHARPLTQQGRSDAASVGRALQAVLSGPLLVLASDARRTMETAALAFAAAGEIRSVAALYAASPATLLQAVRSVSPPGDTLVLVGHNPGLSEFAKQLVGAGSTEDRARVEAGLPTAGAALCAFNGPWSTVGPHTGRLVATLLPDGKSWPD